MARSRLCSTIEHLFTEFFCTFDRAVHGGEPRGHLTEPEFVAYAALWNLSPEDARTLFADVDADRTGRVTLEQYLLAAWDFYFCMDEHAGTGKNFLGVLQRKRISLVM